jgi:hypothetical protein
VAPEAEAPIYVPGVKGKAARFNGKASLRTGTVPALPAGGAATWAFHVRIDRASPVAGVIAGNRRVPGRPDGLTFMKVTAETVQFFNGRADSVRIRHGLPAGEWIHVAIVKDGSSLRVFRDGRAVVETTVGFDMPELPFYLGGDPVAGEMAACLLDEAMLFNRALGAAEIGTLAAGGDVAEGRILHLPLDGPPEPAR